MQAGATKLKSQGGAKMAYKIYSICHKKTFIVLIYYFTFIGHRFGSQIWKDRWIDLS